MATIVAILAKCSEVQKRRQDLVAWRPIGFTNPTIGQDVIAVIGLATGGSRSKRDKPAEALRDHHDGSVRQIRRGKKLRLNPAMV